jgi:hypothetical protein
MTTKKVTDSFKAYDECLEAIRRFLDEVVIRNGEAWIRDVCFGSPKQPVVRAALLDDPAGSVAGATRLAVNLAEEVRGRLETAIQASRQTMEELSREGEVDPKDFIPLVARVTALERLVTAFDAFDWPPYHPEALIGRFEILRGSIVEGDAVVRVRVVTTYLL